MNEILEILEKNARITPEEIAQMLDCSVSSVKKAIKKFQAQGVILGYKTIINKELMRNDDDQVRAIIEVKVMPQKDLGFDNIAKRIYSFSEVKSCYLLSGTYDLLLVVEGRNIHTVSNFVAQKLAPLENVRGTTTHFLLKKYKEDSMILKHKDQDRRIAISY